MEVLQSGTGLGTHAQDVPTHLHHLPARQLGKHQRLAVPFMAGCFVVAAFYAEVLPGFQDTLADFELRYILEVGLGSN